MVNFVISDFGLRQAHPANSSSTQVFLDCALPERHEMCDEGSIIFSDNDVLERGSYAHRLYLSKCFANVLSKYGMEENTANHIAIAMFRDSISHHEFQRDFERFFTDDIGAFELYVSSVKGDGLLFYQAIFEKLANYSIVNLSDEYSKKERLDYINARFDMDIAFNDTLLESRLFFGSNKLSTIRYDPVYKFWTFYNSHNGARFRVKFDYEQDSLLQLQSEVNRLKNVGVLYTRDGITRSSRPETLDVKITDYCEYGCKFCYTSSLKDGVHGDIMDWFELEELKKAGVFQVVIGGGGPTKHPQFLDFVRTLNHFGIEVNFTTRAYMEYKKKGSDVVKQFKEYSKYVTAVAFSVLNARELKKVIGFVQEVGTIKQVNIHIVMGMVSKEETIKILQLCEENDFLPVLLGYKSVGFGANIQPLDYSWWFDVVDNVSAVAIDSVMVEQFASQLTEHGAPIWSFGIEDGRFTWFIDMVQKKAGVNSYSAELKSYSNMKQALEQFTNYSGGL